MAACQGVAKALLLGCLSRRFMLQGWDAMGREQPRCCRSAKGCLGGSLLHGAEGSVMNIQGDVTAFCRHRLQDFQQGGVDIRPQFAAG